MSTIYHYVHFPKASFKIKRERFTFDFNQNEEDINFASRKLYHQSFYHYEGDSNPE